MQIEQIKNISLSKIVSKESPSFLPVQSVRKFLDALVPLRNNLWARPILLFQAKILSAIIAKKFFRVNML